MDHKNKISTPSLEQDAAACLATGNYKQAIESYKILMKQNPHHHYQNAIRDCYIKRAAQLGKKKLYPEAIVLWENHCAYCHSCDHYYLYINLLLIAGFTNKAANVFVQHKNTLNESQLINFEEIFAALLLGEKSRELLALFSEESLLNKHYGFANQALSALAIRDTEKLETALTAISFRSPYKHLRFVLQGIVLILRNQIPASIVERIPSTSPFFQLLHVAQLAIAPPLKLAQALSTLNQVEFNFLAALKGWMKDQQKYLDKLRHLREPLKPRILFDLIIDNQPLINKESAKRWCYSLLPLYIPAIHKFEKAFGKLLPEEKIHIKTLCALAQENASLPDAWMKYETTLASIQSQTPLLKLKRAFVLRYVANNIINSHGPDCQCPWSQKSVVMLEKSIDLDPQDKPALLNIIQRHQKQDNIMHCHQWIDKALCTFPNDRELLIIAIETTYRHKLPDKAIQYANTLLELDPINPLAQRYITESQLMKTQHFILQKKWNEAGTILTKLASTTPYSLKLLLRLNEGLYQYSRGNIAEARQLLVSSGENTISVRLQLLIEAEKLRIPFKKIEDDILSTSIDNILIRDKEELFQLIKIINAAAPNIKWKSIFDHIKKPLDQIMPVYFTTSELDKLFECFFQLKQFNIITAFIKNQPQLKKHPLLIYYTIISRVKGNISKLKDADIYKLENALDQARYNKDIRTSALIDKLLSEAFEDDLDIPEPMLNMFQKLMEEMS